MTEEQKEIRENFCGICAVGPLVFAGASATAIGGTMARRHKKWRRMLLISGVSSIVMSALVLFYYLVIKKDCKSCKL